jgi:uncharacterized protein
MIAFGSSGDRLARSEPGLQDGAPLSPREARAAAELVRRVHRHVPAGLVYALLFGSKARGEARPDSDVDVLLIFDELPRDREPQASIAEDIAADVTREFGLEVSSWSVSLVDLEYGMRTPMLVDAMEDAVPLWPALTPVPRPPFTPADARRCTGALLQRLVEGSSEAAELRRRGEYASLARRMRDDLTRLCTAGLLLRGETRPRRADVARRYRALLADSSDGGVDPLESLLLQWVIRSYGPSGRDDERPVPHPPVEYAAVARYIDELSTRVVGERERLMPGRFLFDGSGPEEPAEDVQLGSSIRGLGNANITGRSVAMEYHEAISA